MAGQFEHKIEALRLLRLATASYVDGDIKAGNHYHDLALIHLRAIEQSEADD